MAAPESSSSAAISNASSWAAVSSAVRPSYEARQVHQPGLQVFYFQAETYVVAHLEIGSEREEQPDGGQRRGSARGVLLAALSVRAMTPWLVVF